MIDPASAAAAAALEGDPFYRCITSEFDGDDARRRAALLEYFGYSIGEGERMGRVVHPEEPHSGVAVWLLPTTAAIHERERARKEEFLHKALGARGCRNYHGIVAYMSARAVAVVGSDAWYLSIIAIAPHAQGRGLGARLLAPTLAEADAAGALCYLETFNPRSPGFYQRVGFVTRAEFDEPTTGARYAIMLRRPRPRSPPLATAAAAR